MPTRKGKDNKGDFYQWGLNNPRTKKYYLDDYKEVCSEYWSNSDDIQKCEILITKFLANKQGQAIKIFQKKKK